MSEVGGWGASTYGNPEAIQLWHLQPVSQMQPEIPNALMYMVTAHFIRYR